MAGCSPRKCAHGVWQYREDPEGFSRFCTVCSPPPITYLQPADVATEIRKWDRLLREKYRLGMGRGQTSKLFCLRDICNDEGDVYTAEEQLGDHAYEATKNIDREVRLKEGLAADFLMGTTTEWARRLGIAREAVQRMRSELLDVDRAELENVRKSLAFDEASWLNYKLGKLIEREQGRAMRANL